MSHYDRWRSLSLSPTLLCYISSHFPFLSHVIAVINPHFPSKCIIFFPPLSPLWLSWSIQRKDTLMECMHTNEPYAISILMGLVRQEWSYEADCVAMVLLKWVREENSSVLCLFGIMLTWLSNNGKIKEVKEESTAAIAILNWLDKKKNCHYN